MPTPPRKTPSPPCDRVRRRRRRVATAVEVVVAPTHDARMWLQAARHCWGASLKRVLAGGRRHARPLVPAPSSPRFFRGKVDR
eukprot:9125963-Pyramimonas_sp.AAC.1